MTPTIYILFLNTVVIEMLYIDGDPTKMDFDRVRSKYSILTTMAKLGCDMTLYSETETTPFKVN